MRHGRSLALMRYVRQQRGSNNRQANTGEQMNEYGLDSPRARELIAAARAMGPALVQRRAQCKAQRRVPDETVDDFQKAGFFKILQPEQWGGYAMDPQVFYMVGFEVAPVLSLQCLDSRCYCSAQLAVGGVRRPGSAGRVGG